jgi:hypothetical protein
VGRRYQKCEWIARSGGTRRHTEPTHHVVAFGGHFSKHINLREDENKNNKNEISSIVAMDGFFKRFDSHQD